jgi:hypothetical protein
MQIVALLRRPFSMLPCFKTGALRVFRCRTSLKINRLRVSRWRKGKFDVG